MLGLNYTMRDAGREGLNRAIFCGSALPNIRIIWRREEVTVEVAFAVECFVVVSECFLTEFNNLIVMERNR